MGKLVKSKKLIGKRTTPIKAKIADFKVELRSDNTAGYPEHDVIVTKDKKKTVVLENEPDLGEAFKVWENELDSERSDYKSKIKPLDLTKNDQIVVSALKDVFEKNKGSSGRITAKKLERKLGDKLRIKEAQADRVAMLITRLENRGFIEVQYRTGLPMYGRGLDGDPNKRLLKIQFE